MHRILFISLLLAGSCLAGTVKTFDGVKVDKDSVAELRVYFQEGKKYDKIKLFAYVISIDTTRLFDKLLSGEHHTSILMNDRERFLEEILINAGVAEKMKRVYLSPCEHRILIQGIMIDSHIRAGEYGYSKPVDLVFTPECGKVYRIGVSILDNHWTVWITDRTDGRIVAETKGK